ncbi:MULTISPECIES: PDZ domain-containing protein [Niastella]|uniref:PDZ domain-containing protein n=1 Tax=Niastella soli TaxID=2821487 RepID=A0ABS3YNY7_9BACT|nr:PDZ domain-containing protein [Niastella soli]MBO9199180.1 PDZ domain-containing protein [Niastella soli]
MRRFLISCTAIAAVFLLLCQPLAAQDTKDKDKDKDKSKMNDNEEIIIKRKGDKDTKITIEIKDDEVIVNGKPLDDFDDDNIVIKKGRTLIYGPGHSPFTGANSFHFDGSNNLFLDKSPFLGVITEKAEKGGAEIQDVTENSAADKAGLKENDIITKIDNETVNGPDDLTRIIRKHKPEDKIDVTYDRKGKIQSTNVTLGKKNHGSLTFTSPNFDPLPNFNFDWQDNENFNHNFDRSFRYSMGKPRLGIKAQDTDNGIGVKVLDVDNESAAEKAGIKKDDVITEFDGKKVNNTQDLINASRGSGDKTAVKVTFNRNGKSQSVEIKTPKKLNTANL